MQAQKWTEVKEQGRGNRECVGSERKNGPHPQYVGTNGWIWFSLGCNATVFHLILVVYPSEPISSEERRPFRLSISSIWKVWNNL